MSNYSLTTFPFSAAVKGGTAVTINVPLPGPGEDGGVEFFNTLEIGLKMADTTGSGGTPTCDVKAQCSFEQDFATAGLIKDMLAMTQTTASAASEVKSVKLSTTVFSGLYRRLSIVADTASGDRTFSGTVWALFYNS